MISTSASSGFASAIGHHSRRPGIHLVQRTPEEQASAANTGAIDHIAFRGIDLDATRRALADEGFAFREASVPRDNSVQLFVRDPDGVSIELNFQQDPLH